MELAYILGGGTPHMIKYIVDGGVTINAGAGVRFAGGTANNEGMLEVTTTAADGGCGAALDEAASTDAQTGTTVDNAGFVTCVVNPDAAWRAKLSGGAAEDTALDFCSAAGQTADATGAAVVGATDEFMIWGFDGANAGHVRRATAAATVALTFPNDIAAGDRFLESSANHYGDLASWPTLTTNVTQIAAQTAVAAANDNYMVVESELRDVSDSGRTNSFVIVVCSNHIFGKLGAAITS